MRPVYETDVIYGSFESNDFQSPTTWRIAICFISIIYQKFNA